MKRLLRMKNSSYLLLVILFFASCKGVGKNQPDVSGVKVDTKIERFDQAYFSLDSNNLSKGLESLQKQFPYFANDFTANILGAGPISDSNKVLPVANRHFFTSYYPVYKATEKRFHDLSDIEDDLKEGFRYLKHYYPNYKVPRFISYLGPFDAPGVAITENAIAIGLQLYAGKDFPFYTSIQGQEIFPAYISRRFEKSYIATNCMKAVEEDLYPDKSQGLPLLEQMIEKGKYWWLLDKLMPSTADSIKTGFTAQQLEWANNNEGQIWNLILQNDQLYSMEPAIIQMYIGDAPGIQGFPPSAPGNIGQFIGKKIVKAYTEKIPAASPDQIMKTSARNIFEGAKYKPR